MSRAIAGAGGNIAIIYRSSPDAPQAAEKIAKEFGVTVKAYQADVSDLKRVKDVFAQIDNDLGTISGVVAVRMFLSLWSLIQFEPTVRSAFYRTPALLLSNLLLKSKAARSLTSCVLALYVSLRSVYYSYTSSLDSTNVLGVFNTAQAAAKLWIAKGYKQGLISSYKEGISTQTSRLCQAPLL
jgi:NAD(P)-dependent dehydrogenase (short-subunit alcohol dehydrogenase family)